MVMPQKANGEKKRMTYTVKMGDLTWVDMSDPVQEDRKYLSDTFHFNPMDVEDYFSPGQMPKVDEYQKYLSVIFHMPAYDKVTKVSTIFQWAAFVGENFLVTLHPGVMRSIADLRQECEASEEARKNNMTQGSGFLLYQILDRSVDSYFPALDRIILLVDEVEDRVFDEGVEVGKEISILRRDILTQRRVMFPLRALLKELEDKLKRFSKVDLTVFYGDLMDHMNKICDTLDTGKETIEIFKDADYTLAGYRANGAIRSINAILASTLPFVVIAILFMAAMAGGVIPGSTTAFIALIILGVLISAGTLYTLHRKRLI
jgi:magnesium transporter